MKKLIPFLLLFSCQTNTPQPDKEACYTCDLVVTISLSGTVNESATQKQFNGIYCGDDVEVAKKAANKTKTTSPGGGITQRVTEKLECKLKE